MKNMSCSPRYSYISVAIDKNYTRLSLKLEVIGATKVRKIFETCKPKLPISKDFANFETFFANFESRPPKIVYFETPKGD